MGQAFGSFFEPLEGRQLLSGSLHHGPGRGGFAGGGATIEFSQAPSAVQSGLTSLAATDNVTAPAATDTVFLGNSNGVETYTVRETSAGTVTRLTVDSAGHAVTAPTRGSTTFGAIDNAPVTDEINAIATALNLTAATSTTKVNTSTASDGTITYSLRLTSASTTTTGKHSRGAVITVDSTGLPVGNQTLPFSTLPTAIQNGLSSHAPSGTAIAATQKVRVATIDGVNTYSATFTSTGTRTTITVDSAGALVSLPTRSTTTFADSSIPAAAKTELQTLATDKGVSGTIADTQTVGVLTEVNGTTIYSVALTDSNGHRVRISVDQAGNPTVPPNGGGLGFGFGFGGDHGERGKGGPGGGADDSSSAGNAGSTITTSAKFALFRR
jgi:hypothetical protein